MSRGDISLSVVPGKLLEQGQVNDHPVLVSIKTPDGSARTPSDICCVIDISWSMSMEAKVQAAGGAVESNGLSMLDVAKHAARTIVRTLTEQDRLSIVTFCREAVLVLPLTDMNEAGQKLAEEKMEEIGFGNGTQIWQGIDKAFSTLREQAVEGRLAHVMLLTDGTTEDKDTVMPNLRGVVEKHERLPCTINCFGFGYEIDSELLLSIAEYSSGSYAFIPDAGFVGTIFVNCMGNLLVTMARDATLTLQASDTNAKIEVLGGWPQRAVLGEGGVVRIPLGTLQYGQTKDIALQISTQVSAQPFLTASLECSKAGAAAREVLQVRAEGKMPGDAKDFELVHRNICRSIFVQAVEKALRAATMGAEKGTEETMRQATAELTRGAEQVAASPAASSEAVCALLEDLQGQCMEATSRLDYYQKWGRHYLPSIMLAHKLQQCNNFKDPGVQVYGGQLFESTRDDADAKFDTMPAPQVTPAMYRYLGDGKVIRNPTYGGGRPAAAAAVNMAAYNDRYAGCIDGDSEAQLATGERRRVADLRKGDLVLAGGADGAEAEVVCLVCSRCPAGAAPLVELPGGARLTPFHPVFLDGKWCFPVELREPREVACEAVYSVVLRGAPSLQVGGVPCIGLGHGVEEDAAKHPYFGSQRVLEDLARLPGYGAGFVELAAGGGFERDPATGLVCGLNQ